MVEPSFRACPGCGNLTPAENPRCAHCGLDSAEAVIAERALAAERRFLQTLFTRSNPYTMIFIGINVGVYALMCLAGGISLTSVEPEVLRAFGAKENKLIIEHHQYWRLVTSIFIHIGIIHLFLNNYALWIIGQEIERMYGSSRFVFLYLATGVGGSLASYVFNPEPISAGASGAIFGLFGVMATFAFKYRKEIPDALSREIKRRVLPIIAINLVFGLSVQIVDNAAHIGGLLSGVALALLVPYKRPNERITPVVWRALQIICVAIILVSFVGAFRIYHGPPLGFSNLTPRSGSSVVTYFENMQDASRSLGESLQALATAIDRRNAGADVRTAAQAVDRGLRAVRSVPRIDTQSEQYRNRLKELVDEQKRILDGLANAGSKNWTELEGEEEALIQRYNGFAGEYDQWVRGFMKEHGYEITGTRER